MPMGGASTPVAVIREHKKVSDEIDDVYTAAVSAATDLKSQLATGRLIGNKTELFLYFYRPFFGLYVHTRFSKDLRTADLRPLMDSLDLWFDENKVDQDRMHRGLKLFDKYQREIMQAEIISTRKG